MLYINLIINKGEVMAEKEYLKYRSDFGKINIYILTLDVLSIIFILMLVFLPICQRTVIVSLENGLTEEINFSAFSAVIPSLENGLMEKVNFSFFDEVLNISKAIIADNGGYSALLFDFGVLPFTTIVYSLVYICICIKSLIVDIGNLNNIEEYSMLNYTAIKKSGGEKETKKLMRNQTIYGIISFAIMSIVSGFIMKGLLNYGYEILSISGFANICGFSIWAIFIVLVLVGFIVISMLNKKCKKNLTVKILNEEYSVVENGVSE